MDDFFNVITMGLFEGIKNALPTYFSFYDFVEVLNYTEDDHKKARNILRSFAKRGYIKRISRNNYMKL